MSVSLSPILNGWQSFTANGLPNNGGFINTYLAGSSTPAATYTTNTGSTPNSNPIVLNASGYPPQEIWLTDGIAYKFVVTDSSLNIINTYDNIVSISSANSYTLSQLSASTGSSLIGYNQGSTGAVTETVQSKLRERVSVKDFGAKGDNATDDTAAIQLALNNAAGRVIYFPAGGYQVSNLTINNACSLEGEDYALSQINQKTGSTGHVITINGIRHPSMRFLSVAGCPTGGDCVHVQGASSGNQFLECFFTLSGTGYGIYVGGTTDDVVCLDTIFEANFLGGVYFDSGATAGSVTNCRFNVNTGHGVIINGNNTNPGHRIVSNQFGGNTCGVKIINSYYNVVSDNYIVLSGSHGIYLNGGAFNNITGNHCNNNTGDGIHSDNATLVPSNNNIVGNTCYLNANGIMLNFSNNCNIIGNNIQSNLAVGLGLASSGDCNVEGNQILGNGLTLTPKYGIYINDPSNGASSNNRIIGNSINNQANGALQTTGIFQSGSPANTVIMSNNISATTPLNISGGGTKAIKFNTGYVTENGGSGGIAAAATSVTLNHGLSYAPDQSAFAIMPVGGPTNNPGCIFISNITTTQFQVNCQFVPGVSTLPFYWRANA